MKLTNAERERISDSALKVQSVRNSLDQVAENIIPNRDELTECLENVDQKLREALGYLPAEAPVYGGPGE